MQPNSIKEQARKIFIRYTSILLILVTVAVSAFFYINSSQMSARQTENAAAQLSAQLASVHESYTAFIERMKNSERVHDYIRTQSGESSLFQSFYEFNTDQTVQSDFFLFDQNEALILSNALDNDQLSLSQADYFASSIRLIRLNGEDYITRVNRIPYHNGKISSFLYGSEVLENGEVTGYIFYMLHEEDFLDLLFQQAIHLAVITDQFDTIVATSNNSVGDFLNKYRPQPLANGNVKIRENELVQSQDQVEGTSLTVYTLNPPQTITSPAIWLVSFLIVLFISLFFLLKVMSDRLSYSLTASVNGMIESIKHFKSGNADYYLKPSEDYEIQVLTDQFNAMLDEINTLISEKEELSERQKQTEIKQLEAQFNPHFVFNILESIRYLILIEPRRAEESILALSKLLRYSVKHNEDKVSVQEELNYLEHYMKLHHLRFNQSIQYEVKMDPMVRLHIEQIVIPKLLFQPLIENAIKHGYSTGKKLNILISLSFKNHQLICSVTDNGQSINEAQLTNLQNQLQLNRSSQLGLGLYNVHRRIQLLFPENKGVHLSLEYEGFSVSFSIPLMLIHERGVI
ncbi:sensor histidine kinase [Jeotgalibacillus sp. JSM ZJ347]|uniref:sensor histidine kinase n=1 Tax=Jeotgalibacillus sp. JSM ZJ347 TaxID=3342117 RepID=UPI0035A84EEA